MLKNTLLNMLGMLIPGLLMLPATAYLARSMSVELYGVLLLAYSILGYTSVFDGGLTRAVIRAVAMSTSTAQSKAIMGTALLSVFCLSLVPALCLFLFSASIVDALSISAPFKAEARLAVEVLAAAVPFFLLGQTAFAYLEGKQDFVRLNQYKIFTGVLIATLPALMVAGYKGLVAAIFGLLIARTLAACIAFLALRKSLGTLRLEFHGSLLRRLASFGGWITLSNFLQPLMVYGDKFILSNGLGAGKAAFYTAPADLVEKLAILPGALSRTLFPLFSAHTNDIKRQERWAYGGLIAALLAVLAPIFVFSSWLLNAWLGGAYGQESSGVLRVLLVGFFFNALAQIPFSRIQAMGQSKATALLHLFELGPYFLLLFYLMGQHGLQGAAYAWSIRVGVDFLFLLWLSRWYQRRDVGLGAGQ